MKNQILTVSAQNPCVKHGAGSLCQGGSGHFFMGRGGIVMNDVLIMAVGKLQAVSLALRNDLVDISRSENRGLSYIVDEVMESLEALDRDMDREKGGVG